MLCALPVRQPEDLWLTTRDQVFDNVNISDELLSRSMFRLQKTLATRLCHRSRLSKYSNLVFSGTASWSYVFGTSGVWWMHSRAINSKTWRCRREQEDTVYASLVRCWALTVTYEELALTQPDESVYKHYSRGQALQSCLSGRREGVYF